MCSFQVFFSHNENKEFAVYKPEKFAFLIPRNVELFTPEDSIFLTKYATF